MYYNLIKDIVDQIADYEQDPAQLPPNVRNFSDWLQRRLHPSHELEADEPAWEGKENGRSADSVINTLLVHLYRYARLQAKAAIEGSRFSTMDDFIYLITLTAKGSMSKTALIRMNIHEKSSGIQIINRLISAGMVEQLPDRNDKRSRLIHITDLGKSMLEASMGKIRTATVRVTEPLNQKEKMDLIRILSKLEVFHENNAGNLL